jgi:hypothetical protein
MGRRRTQERKGRGRQTTSDRRKKMNSVRQKKMNSKKHWEKTTEQQETAGRR